MKVNLAKNLLAFFDGELDSLSSDKGCSGVCASATTSNLDHFPFLDRKRYRVCFTHLTVTVFHDFGHVGGVLGCHGVTVADNMQSSDEWSEKAGEMSQLDDETIGMHNLTAYVYVEVYTMMEVVMVEGCACGGQQDAFLGGAPTTWSI